MSRQVNEFFLAYEKANSSSEPSAMGNFYASTFMFGGLNGVQAVQREDFLKFIPKLKAHLSSMGLVESRLVNVEANPISPMYLLAKVGWRMKVQSSAGDRYVDASATYVLMQRENEALLVVFQIDHQDLAALIGGQQV